MLYPTKVGAKWVYESSDSRVLSWTLTAVEDKDGAKIARLEYTPFYPEDAHIIFGP